MTNVYKLVSIGNNDQVQIITVLGTVGVRDAVTSSSKFFGGRFKILANFCKFSQNLGKIQMLHPQKHLISYSYDCASKICSKYVI